MSGKLIMNALVMYDRQTGTLWSQFLGRGVSGPLSGTPLEMIPVTLTTWDRWLAEYPDTVALDKSKGHYIGDTYSTYYGMEHAAGVLGQENEDGRLPNKELVLGVGFDEGPKAYPFSRLADERVVNDFAVDQPVVVYFDPTSDSAIAYERVIDGKELTFSLREEEGLEYLVDEETGTLWLPFSGTAVKGELAGSNLARIRSTYSFWFAWTDYYPDTELYQ